MTSYVAYSFVSKPGTVKKVFGTPQPQSLQAQAF